MNHLVLWRRGKLRIAALAGLSSAALLACGSRTGLYLIEQNKYPTQDGGLPDGTLDAPPDAALDGSHDAPLSDAPMDAPRDAPSDSSLDAPVDAPLDAPMDAPLDAPGCMQPGDCPVQGDLCHPTQCVMGQCLTGMPINCDDHNPCTLDSCDPATGQCLHMGGMVTTCQQLNSSCPGTVGPSVTWVPSGAAPILVSEPSFTTSFALNLGYSQPNDSFLAGYVGDQVNVLLRPLDGNANPSATSIKVNNQEGDGNDGAIVWAQDRYGMAWADRRFGNFEVFFNTFTPDGQKFGPDVRLTDTPGFSINESITWDGNQFYVAFQDDSSGSFQVFGMTVAVDGTVLTGMTPLSLSGLTSESPTLALANGVVGAAFFVGDATQGGINFSLLSTNLSVQTEIPLIMSGHPSNPSITTDGSNFAVMWNDRDQFTLAGAELDTQGNLTTPVTQVQSLNTFTRDPVPLGLGGRNILFYSGNDGMSGYQLSWATLDSQFNVTTPPSVLVQGLAPALPTSFAIGTGGDLFVYFSGSPNGDPSAGESYITRLTCQTLLPP